MKTTTSTQAYSIQDLAQAYGIQLEWKDIWGQAHPVDESMCQALLTSMQVPAETPADVAQSMAIQADQAWQRWLEPVLVVPEAQKHAIIRLRLPQKLQKQELIWTLRTESGELREGRLLPERLPVRESRTLADGRQVLGLDWTLETLPGQGYHTVALAVAGTDDWTSMLLVVTPEQCYTPPALCDEAIPPDASPNARAAALAKVWGPAVQLYAVHSNRNWGMGDFTDLSRLVDWSAQQGASMIGLNPLHALFPHNPAHCSPYSPSSRVFFNIMYLDVESVADFSESEEARQLVYSPAFQEALAALREPELVPYAEVGRRKLDVLELLYQNFCRQHLASQTKRAQAFEAYVKEQGGLLERFALFHALQERFHQEDSSVWGWPVWPEAYRDPSSPAVAEFAQSNRERIGFYQYLQWQADEQLHAVGLRCLQRRLGVGLYMDMAVGVDRGGADVWANQHLFADGSGVGAPPDEYNQKGQDWGLPPLIPEKMREESYASFIQILRQNMKYAGALRIDHVMGLLRLFWIPPGLPPSQGAYVHYPVDELFGILALESQRNQCMVIGEDMGTVPEAIQTRMAQWGVYSYKVFYFENTAPEQFIAPEHYQETAAVAISTHDLPTLKGFWEGRDLAVRTELDLYPTKELRDRQVNDRVMERVGILRLLESQNLLPDGVTTDPASIQALTTELSAAVHALVSRTFSKVFMVQFEDMLGQSEQINLPGTVEPLYPNWRRRLTMPLEDLVNDERVRRIVEAIRAERPLRGGLEPDPVQGGGGGGGLIHGAPRATYRFQFNKHFTFRQAAALIPYLAQLGISHCYASPLLKARSDSAHGYDITDHHQINSEIGTPEDFEHLTSVLREHGMGLIVDIVPNHMGAGKDNPWWMDVLEHGPSSRYADYFDIDWQPQPEELQQKILLPILGGLYGQILEQGELTLRFEADVGRFWLDYYEHTMPINPSSYPVILTHRQGVLESRLGRGEALLEYQSILSAFGHLPVLHSDDSDFSAREVRARESLVACNRLAALCRQCDEVCQFIHENVRDFQASQQDSTSLIRLHRLLEQQAYRLANWRVASDEINYRRFFDVNDLVAVRVEDPRVFNETHALIMDWVEQGKVHGLRIDHPDGLYDPAAYFARLQQEAARRLNLPEPQADADGAFSQLPLYVAVEKILAPFERLPDEWQVHGTTGYEFANAVTGLFVDQEHEKELTRLYEKLLGHRIHFEDLVYHCKKLIMRTTLNGELGVLAHQLDRISNRNWMSRDYTMHDLRAALIETVACFPVYRTYVTPERQSKKDRDYIEWAIRAAKRRSSVFDTTVFDFIHEVLLTEVTTDASAFGGQADEAEDFRAGVIRFAMKFQQYTGPVMAKGLEDTSFYRYNRLVSLNEVGGEPKQFGLSVQQFHHQNLERMRRSPLAMLNLSTHDTKRSADVRARISVLSGMPDEWGKHVMRWRKLHRSLHRATDTAEWAPTANDEYLFYQTLIGVWPLTPPTEDDLAALSDRLEQYMLKAVREAKIHTSWINQNADYEDALSHFVRSVVQKPSRMFLSDFVPFQKHVARLGLFNALSQMLLELTCPGVPDVYQGNECWDFSLVDPDNRRPVDYTQRQRMLADMHDWIAQADYRTFTERVSELTAQINDGRIKQFVMTMALQTRARQADLFTDGAYIPLEVTGTHSEHIVAFARQHEGEAVLVVVPRLLHRLGIRRQELPCGHKVWKDTAILLPETVINSGQLAGQPALWTHVLTRDDVRARNGVLMVADVLRTMPVALMTPVS